MTSMRLFSAGPRQGCRRFSELGFGGFAVRLCENSDTTVKLLENGRFRVSHVRLVEGLVSRRK